MLSIFSNLQRLIKEFSIGLGQYFNVFKFISEHKLYPYLFKSAFVAFLTFSTLLFGAFFAGGALHQLLVSQELIEIENETLSSIFSGFIYVLTIIPLLFISILLYKQVIQILLSPMLGSIVEKVLTIQKGKEVSLGFSLSLSLKGFWFIVLPNLQKELGLMMVLFGFSLLPVIGLAASPLMFLVSCYFLGFSSLDIINETLQMPFKIRKRHTWQHLGYVLGNGVGFTLIFMVPVLGTFTAPILSVIAAALGYKHIDDMSNWEEILKEEEEKKMAEIKKNPLLR